MINVHLYPSPFLNESRILREAGSLSRLGLFDRIDLVGIGQEGVPGSEHVQDGIRILRLGRHGGASGMMDKIARTGGWSHAVYQRYRKEKIACINCHSVTTLPLGVMLKQTTGAKLVYDAHELETEANGLRGARKYLTKQVERALIGHADHCIFVGSAIEQWYVREYGLGNTTVLYNCPPRQEMEHSDHFRKTYAIPLDKPVFLYQGVIGEGRGIRILLEAFSRLAEQAVLIVMGYGLLADWFAEQAARHPSIHYHPAVPPDRLLAYTAAADFGLSVIEGTSLSYEYCMPNKLFEYVMARKPVLVSPTREQRDFVHRHAIGEVASGTSVQAIQEAALRLLERTPASLQSALTRTRDEYCWERQETKLEAVYLNALGFRPRAYRLPVSSAVIHHDLCG